MPPHAQAARNLQKQLGGGGGDHGKNTSPSKKLERAGSSAESMGLAMMAIVNGEADEDVSVPCWSPEALTLRQGEGNGIMGVEVKIKVYALTNVDVKGNTFSVDMNLMLDWEVAEDGPDGYNANTTFWEDHFRVSLDFGNGTGDVSVELPDPRQDKPKKGKVRFKVYVVQPPCSPPMIGSGGGQVDAN